MEVQITHSGVANDVAVSASVPGIVQVVPVVPTVVEVQLFRDGKDGKSAYEIAVQNDFLGTEQQWLSSLISGNNAIKNEIPIGLINGLNTTFTTQNNFIPESVEVFLNGLIQQKTFEFQTIGSKTIILNISPSFGETISINYIKL
jgi:hypothetical protein